MNTNTRRSPCLLLIALLLMAACEKSVPPPEPPRPVLTSTIGATQDKETNTYSGEVRSRYETQLGFRIPGKISARLVDSGSVVKAGDVLARLDPVDANLSATAAKAQLALADAELRRYRELRAKNFVSSSALDAKETAFKAARAQAELAVNQSAYAVLRADQAGVVESVAAEVGQVVAAGQAVLRLARPDELEVAIAIPESRRANLHLQQTATIRLWSDPQASYKGTVRELSPVADTATRTYAARVSILQPDAKIALGMTANVALSEEASSGEGETKLRVPLTALFQHEGKPALWVVQADQTLALKPVVVAAYTEKEAVLSSGITSGERYVVAGVHKLAIGEKIKAVDLKTDTAAR